MFTFEYVEPYSDGSCHTYTNCMHCLSDSLCGWCEPSQRCLARVVQKNSNTTELPQCYLDVENNTDAFLVLSPLQCTNCSNHISCHQCANDGICEWLVDEAYCTRRGRQVSNHAAILNRRLTLVIFSLSSVQVCQFNSDCGAVSGSLSRKAELRRLLRGAWSLFLVRRNTGKVLSEILF